MNALKAIVVLAFGMSASACSAEVADDARGLGDGTGALADENTNVDARLAQAVNARRFPGAVVHAGALFDVGQPQDDQLYTRAYGSLAYDAHPVTEETVYDLASLTKALAATTAVMREVDRRKIALDDAVTVHLPGLDSAYSGITVRKLLAHGSCLVDGPPSGSLSDTAGRGAEVSNVVSFMNRNVGRVFLRTCTTNYSDLNFVLAGAVVQSTSGTRLDRYLHDAVFAPLGMNKTTFLPPSSWKDSIAPTEVYGASGDRVGRKGAIWGEVHDETSFYFGGVGGNAGLFATAPDLGKLVRALLRDELVSRKTRDAFFASQGTVDQFGNARALGWEFAPAHCGKGFGPRTVGHTGFAGTSVCIDPERNAYSIVLTNRVYPSRNGGSIHADRVALSAALSEKVDPCALRPTWSGVCGNSPQGDRAGRTGVLYECRKHRATRCERGCVSAPAGSADHCAP